MRNQDAYPMPLQQREMGGIVENQSNYGRGPCFNCKEYGHFSRDCPEIRGPQGTFIKNRYYPPQQSSDIPTRPLRTETHPKSYYPSQNSYKYTEGRQEDDEEGYPLSDFEESTTLNNKGVVSKKPRNPLKVKLE